MAGVTLTQRRPIANLHHNPASHWRHLDLVLLGAVAAISGLGLLMVYSATRGVEEPYDTSFLKKQLMFVVLGGLVLGVTASVDYRRIRDFAPRLYGLTVLLLVLVKSPLGSSQHGTQGWFQLGAFQLQPSELAKVGLIVGFAWLASQFRGRVDGRRLLALLVVATIPMGLVMLQPDLGTTLVSVAITAGLLLVAGTSGRQMAALGAAALVLVVVVFNSGMLGSYQQDRLTSYLSQKEVSQPVDLSTASPPEYNLRQSKIAIGAGGIWGQGLFEGTQTRLRNVPYQHTDFIFTAVGEQLGLVGAGALLALFSVVVWRVWRTAQLTRDEFGSMLCVGVLGLLVFQIFENVGMTMGIMPITGIPLPFMSYGGSSTITYFAAVGLVVNVHMRRFS